MKKIINLNPRVIESYKNNSKINKFMFKICFLFIIILIVSSFPMSYINKSIRNNIDIVTEEIEKHSEVISYNLDLKKETKDLELFIKSITSIGDLRWDISKTIEEINKHIPQNLKFTDLTFNEDGLIKIKGETISYDAIPEFIGNLEMSKSFESVKVEQIVTKKSNIIVGRKPVVNKDDVPENIIDTKITYEFSILLRGLNIYEKE